jgi:hypothetical protein
MTRTAALLCSIVVCSVMTGCDGSGVPPRADDVKEAMQIYIGDREGSTDSKGRYKGPRVSKIQDLKCDLADEKSNVFKCTFKFTVKRRESETIDGTYAFRRMPIKVEEKGKEVEKIKWRVAA